MYKYFRIKVASVVNYTYYYYYYYFKSLYLEIHNTKDILLITVNCREKKITKETFSRIFWQSIFSKMYKYFRICFRLLLF